MPAENITRPFSQFEVFNLGLYHIMARRAGLSALEICCKPPYNIIRHG
ncbi:hypothetical protein D1AOALGA4SA_3967 [Olavius algarvensis Delta 1 endosymbiont]|nr:hypothetical protein D1AOALGA4SA_3967 [Olavius algarvensis Delta 1 endosymbiont]